MRMRTAPAGAAALAAVLLFAPPALPQAERSFDGEVGQDAAQGLKPAPTAPAAQEAPSPAPAGIEGLVRAAKKRTSLSVANIFTSRDLWRGINWFGHDPAYLLGGDVKIDLTPYDERERRDAWEIRLHTMAALADGLKSGNEDLDRYKVSAALENRFYRYIDLDIGYEHYGLPPFGDHDRDFEELFIRAGFNSLPLMKPISVPGYEKPITEIPFAVHYGAYSGFSSKSFALTNDRFGFHGYPNNWWWHNVEFNLTIPFPDAVPERTFGVLRCLKFDSTVWIIDRPNVLPGLKDGIQDTEFGLALPLICDLGKWSALDRCAWGLFGESKIVVEPFIRYAIDARHLDRRTKEWSGDDEFFGGVALACVF